MAPCIQILQLQEEKTEEKELCALLCKSSCIHGDLQLLEIL